MINTGYITIGEQRYHIAVNWNAISGYLIKTGNDTFDAVASVSAITPSQMPVLMAECIREGERLEGREFTMSATELGANLGVSEINEFAVIFGRAMSADIKKKE